MSALSTGDLNTLFSSARTYNGWKSEVISDDLLHELYDLLKFAPTSANSNPGRFLFLRTAEARVRLRPYLQPGNVDKTMSAPIVVIVARDTRFYDFMPQLFPQRDVRSVFAQDTALAEDTASRNAILQGAYLILAARALGLDVGPMSGFDRAGVDQEFFADGHWKTDFLVNLGHGDAASLHPRNPRLTFEQACRLL